MPFLATAPPELRTGPFTVGQAAGCGVTIQMLRGRSWVRLTRGVYCHANVPVDDEVRLAALRLALPEDAVATDLLAAWALGVWSPPPGQPLPLQWALARGRARPRQTADASRRLVVASTDVVTARGLQCTSPLRTAFQLMRRACPVEAVVVADAFAAAGAVELPWLWAYAEAHRRWPGVARVRSALQHATRHARSPGESRLRMIPVLGGLPEPYVNLPMYRDDTLLGVLDLYLVGRRRVGVEYDGSHHELVDQRHADHRRENRLAVHGQLPLLRYDRFTVARHPERQRALYEMAQAIGVEPLGDLRPAWFADPRLPFRW